MIQKSKITLILCLSIISGVLTGPNFFSIPTSITHISIVLIIISYLSQNKLIYFYIFILGIIIGSHRINTFINNYSTNNIQSIIQPQQTITGQITTIPLLKNNQQYIKISPPQNHRGQLQIITNPFPKYEFGQTIKMSGQMQTPSNFTDEFSYTGYLAKDDIYLLSYYPQITLISNPQPNFHYYIFQLRNSIIKQCQKLYSPDISGLLTGLLVGDKNTMPPSIYEKFRTVGLTHIIVVSGFNLTIFATLFIKFLRGKIKRIYTLILTLVSIITFTILTGAEASIVRALIMTSILVSAPFLGRKNHPTLAILLAAVIMILINPLVLWYDAGFHLSFLATLGLSYFQEPINQIFKIFPIPDFIKSTISETTAAQITTTPYIMTNFNQLAIYTPITNLLVLPLIPLTMLLGFVIMLLQSIIPEQIIQILSLPGTLLLKYIIQIANIFSQLPHHTIPIEITHQYLHIIYLVLVIIAWLYHKHVRKQTN
ncbi:ComEC family competence protein [Patescibacteria group bacterium]|nr:ComEC family competence protein [Patescibacteria group bacterium]